MAQMTISDLNTGMEVRGKVKRIELFGAFVDIGVGKDALLHISQLGKPNVRNVEDVVKADEEVTAYVLKVDQKEGRIALSLVKPPTFSWDSLNENDILDGEVVRVENFGAFVDIGAERPGMVHVSELADGYVKSPSDVVKVGEKVKVRVLKVNRKKRQIDLSMKSPEEKIEMPVDEKEEDMPTAMAMAFRKAMANSDEEVSFRRPTKEKKSRKDQEEIYKRTLRNHSN
jgi:small subunit ribosomal protein S1